jgi:hypothetical protein
LNKGGVDRSLLLDEDSVDVLLPALLRLFQSGLDVLETLGDEAVALLKTLLDLDQRHINRSFTATERVVDGTAVLLENRVHVLQPGRGPVQFIDLCCRLLLRERDSTFMLGEDPIDILLERANLAVDALHSGVRRPLMLREDLVDVIRQPRHLTTDSR